MIEVDLPTVLTITGAILAPLLTVIGILFFSWKDALKRSDERDDKWQSDYNSLRDRMQDKIDSAIQKANDTISTVTTALNAMSNALVQGKDKQSEEWRTLRDDILKIIRDSSK